MGFLDNSEQKNKQKNLSSKEVAEKYSVIISFVRQDSSANTKLKIDLVSNQKAGSRFFIKDDLPFFSLAQKKVLLDVRQSDGWQQEINIEEFFKNLKKSGFNIYYKNGKDISKIFFSNKNLEEKISLDFFKAEKDEFFPVTKDDFVFRASDETEFKKVSSKILFSEGNIFYIKNSYINFFKISPEMKEILKRMINREYDKVSGFFSEKSETKLTETQIFSINKIIKEAKKNFNLKTDLKENFNIKEYKKTTELVEVDFDNEEKTLNIRVLMDYGFRKIDISETVFRSVVGGETVFSRRANSHFGFKYIFSIKDNNIFYAKVDHNKEIELFKYFYSFASDFGFTKNLKLNKKGAKQINNFISLKWDNFKKIKQKIVYTKQKLESVSLDFHADVDVKFSGNNDWLTFDAEFYLGENKVTLSQLQKYALGKTEYIIGENGEMIEVKNKDELEKFISMIETFHQNEESGKFEGKLYNAIDLENIFTKSEYYNSKFNSGFKKFIKEAREGKVIENIKIAKKYTEKLRDYQKAGIDWMYFLKKYHFGGILADDMGLGKTIQALVMLELQQKKGKPSIVIVPKTLMGNWEAEAKKFVKNTKVLLVDGSAEEREKQIKKAKKYNLVITSYSFFQRDSDFYKKEKISFNYAVLDEAQYIKNFKTKNAQVVKTIDADYRLALTGTPLENSISELWSVFEFLMPGFLGKQSDFSKNYVKPILQNNDKEKMKQLKNKISIFMLRRTKESVLTELPPKTVQTLYPVLSDDQSILYQQILANVKSELLPKIKGGGMGKNYINILAALTKLRQVCNHPNLLMKGKDYKKYSSAKMDILLNLISEIKSEGRKVLVFSQFKTMLEILKKELDGRKISYEYLAGETKNRKKVIDDYNNNPETTVFLISLKAGGVGLNLTSADNVVLYDPWWNPSVERQAVDRAHRIGQDKKVNVYKLITKGTIEEKILKLQEKKQGLFDSLVDESADSLKNISWKDIESLFE